MVKIFVGRLSEDVKKSELEELFKSYGDVTDCTVLKNYGFVHMANMDEAKAAISGLDKQILNGSEINVELSTTKVAKASKLFVGNLPADTKSSEIHKMFKKYGTVIECDVVKNYAFVHMGRESMAREAIDALNDTTFNGNKIAVQMARTTKRDEEYQMPGFMYPGDFRGRGRGRGFMGPMRGIPRFRGRPFADDPFLESQFARRGTMRPRGPMMHNRSAALGSIYGHDVLSRGLARREAMLGSGDPYLLREREALARQLDAEVLDRYRGLGGASSYDFSSGLAASDIGLDAGFGGAAPRFGAGRLGALNAGAAAAAAARYGAGLDRYGAGGYGAY